MREKGAYPNPWFSEIGPSGYLLPRVCSLFIKLLLDEWFPNSVHKVGNSF